MYQHVKELRACIDKMYDAAMKQDDERRKEIETLKTYLSLVHLKALGVVSMLRVDFASIAAKMTHRFVAKVINGNGNTQKKSRSCWLNKRGVLYGRRFGLCRI